MFFPKIVVCTAGLLLVALAQAQTSGSGFFPLTEKCRVADSRLVGAPLAGGASRLLNVSDNPSYSAQGGLGSSSSCGIPNDANAYALSVTAIPSTLGGFLKIFPAGKTPSGGNTVVFPAAPGSNANDMIAIPRVNGVDELGVFASVSAHYIVDVVGYFRPSNPASASCTSLWNYDALYPGQQTTLNSHLCTTGNTISASGCTAAPTAGVVLSESSVVSVSSGTYHKCVFTNNGSSIVSIDAYGTCCPTN